MAVDQKLARLRWKQGEEASKDQRQRVKDDLGFYQGEQQWDPDIKTLRQGQQSSGNMPSVPARPCLTINKVRDPIRKIQNDELQADLGMSIIPADDFGGDIDENEIELREGIARRIQRNSNAKDARMWAANRAAIAGEGYYGILTQFVKGSFDQEIIYRRFYNQFSVLLDPNHEQPDGSDIEWAFVGRDVPWDIYKSEYPRLANQQRNPAAADGLSDQEWRAFGDEAPKWFTSEGDARTVRVSEYWWIEREPIALALLADGRTVQLEAAPPGIAILDTREEVKKTVHFSVIDGVHTLSEVIWPGQYIPIIKVVGEEMHVFDKERRYEGLVRPAREPQKAYNAMISSAVETIALAPKSPWMIPAGAIENFEDIWKQAGVRNWPYLPYNAVDPSTQQPIQPPQRNQAEPPIQAMALMIGAFDQSIMATIGQANLADTHPDVRSGEMASTLLDEAARGTSNYLANLIRSVHYEGTIVNDLLYPIYGTRPGRIVSMVNGAQKSERVMIGQPFVTPNPNGMPQPHDPKNPQHAEMQPKTYTLTKDGSFNVAIEATKFYETKQQERLSLMAGLIEKSPEQLGIIGDLFFEAAGDEDMAKRYKAILAPPVQEMLRTGQPEDPRLREAMQMGQMLAQEMQQLKADKHARIEQAQIKAVADATTSDADNQTKLEIARINSQTQLAIAQLKASIDEQSASMRELIETMKLQQEAARTGEKLIEEDRLEQDRAHEVGMSLLTHEQEKDLLSHEAAVMPKPSSNGSGE